VWMIMRRGIMSDSIARRRCDDERMVYNCT